MTANGTSDLEAETTVDDTQKHCSAADPAMTVPEKAAGANFAKVKMLEQTKHGLKDNHPAHEKIANDHVIAIQVVHLVSELDPETETDEHQDDGNNL